MSVVRTIAVLGALGFATACSQSPYPMQREIADVNQQTLTGGVHWQILANHTAEKLFGCLEGLTYWNDGTDTHEPYCRQDVDKIRYTPIFVEKTDSATPFGEGFHRALVTEVVERGMKVALKPEGALVLTTRLQVLDRPMPLPVNAWPGKYSALGAGIAALELGAPGLLLTGPILDAYDNTSAYGGAQVLITTALLDGDRLVTSKTTAYFIEDADLAQYATTAPPADLTRPMRAGAQPPATRTFSVVEE